MLSLFILHQQYNLNTYKISGFVYKHIDLLYNLPFCSNLMLGSDNQFQRLCLFAGISTDYVK